MLAYFHIFQVLQFFFLLFYNVPWTSGWVDRDVMFKVVLHALRISLCVCALPAVHC